jgi:hypothetical protein
MFRHIRKAIAKSNYQLCHACLSVRLSIRTEQLDSHRMAVRNNSQGTIIIIIIIIIIFPHIQIFVKIEPNNTNCT